MPATNNIPPLTDGTKLRKATVILVTNKDVKSDIHLGDNSIGKIYMAKLMVLKQKNKLLLVILF